jgi:acetylornithine deacetylase/succinyl-diaminopimelate desuccinylase-like protein
VLLDGEEEVGSPHMPDVIRQYADAPDGGQLADLVLWSDGPVHESGHYAVMLGVRGIVAFELRVRGAVRPLHSGNWGGVAPNPAWELTWLLNTMRAPDGRVLVDGFYDDVLPLSPGEQAALDKLPGNAADLLAGAGLSRTDVPADVPLHERLTRPTFSINSLTCDDAGEHRTVIPNVAVAKCDIRLVAAQRPERIVELVRAHVEQVAPHVEFRVTHGGMWPSRTLPETPYTDAVRAGAAAGLGVEPLIVPALGGSLPLSVFTDLLGLPSYGVPLANLDEANHAPNENFEVQRFYDGIKASVGVLDELARRGAAC